MDWLSRWQQGRTGWHEATGNKGLKTFWPDTTAGCRVLVPLCGKSRDLLWLAEQGCDVTGVELSSIAARDFFIESGLSFSTHLVNGQTRYRGKDTAITIVCGDYFEFFDSSFDALYDRASLVALHRHQRPAYIKHTRERLKQDALIFLVTLEYEQSNAIGPPYAVMADEVAAYWPGLKRVSVLDDSSNMSPKFREAGIHRLEEVTWLSTA